ncbi:DUF6402 family protein [Paraburkholderia sp. MMS20-SJTR3]|uniref:DUF6402 family protein n=1 Tax=Paraburkholderia sejongensis TaxID=2886946 RepID=A0ABS8JUJ5_9BURK|nr:DUF6402 family protein [Paraburkholderia sp. MMS20-SJTR3]MCC8393513.1 DUF6402 family protein [Paraburkholderia sp. MMS20-SJTR3]
MANELSYYKINKLIWRWKEKDGARIVREAGLSMDKAPPAPPKEPEPEASPAAPAAKRPKPAPAIKMLDDIEKVANAFSRFKVWLDTPTPPRSPNASSPPPVDKSVPPFDIQEIPGAMRKEMMPVGARLMERWFAGRLNYSPTDADERAKVNQDGHPYPPDMYETDLVKLDWVLKFGRAKRKYDYLLKQAIRSDNARRALRDVLIPYKDGGDLFTTNICGSDPERLHTLFQFQRAEVDGTLAEKIGLQLTAANNNYGVPDDLTAALGSFVFYAAVGHVRFSSDIVNGVRRSNARIAEVTGIWVYVKDAYTFTDKHGQRSQYLGHWSSSGVIVIPLDGIAATSTYIPYVDSPVTIGDPVIAGKVHYPIHNSDFRQWQIRHQRGGDFVIFTDRRFVPLVPPITLYL